MAVGDAVVVKETGRHDRRGIWWGRERAGVVESKAVVSKSTVGWEWMLKVWAGWVRPALGRLLAFVM